MSKSSKSRKKNNPTKKTIKPQRVETQSISTQQEPGKKSLILPVLVGILVIAAVIVAAFFLFKTPEPIDAKDYNLLVITLDTLRADRVGIYGYKNAQTPTLDRLAREGVMFQNCYSTVPLTLPAHSSIFTGRYPLGHGVRGNGIYVLPQKEMTLAETMKEKGFSTFGVISSFVLLSKFGLGQGFDVFDDSLNSHLMYNNYTSEIPATAVYKKFLQWFEKNHQNRFFAWVHLYDPHAPYKAPKRFADKFNKDYLGRYDAEIAFTDEAVNKILEALKKKNALANTLVVIVGDHGEAFGEHEEFGHGFFCYDEALKVPLIFYNQKLLPKNGLNILNRVNIVDIMPTLLEMFRLDISPTIQGNSMLHLMRGKKEKEARNFYFESMHGKDEMNWAPLMGIIDGKYKFISLPEPELYDLTADPNEKENLFRKKNYIAKNLDKKLMKQVTLLSQSGSAADAKRDLTNEDKQHLTSLGYISSFSNKADKEEDPKKGIVLDNKIKRVFRSIGTQDSQQAEQELNQLLMEHPNIDLPILYDMKRQLYEKQGNKDKATAVLKEAIQKHPKIERFYILYAFQIFDRGLIEETESVCRKLIALNPQFTRAYILLGQVAEKRQDIDKAIELYKKALQIEPQNISLKLKYAELMLLKKDLKTALTLYHQLLQRREISNNADLLFKVAILNAQTNDLIKAEALLKQVVTLAPNGKYYFNYALILSRNKKIKEAQSNMEIVLTKYKSELSQRQIQVAQKAITLWKRQ
jgi:arylsulfatase A-like enzyme/Tfp pilus assembly protein PilF